MCLNNPLRNTCGFTNSLRTSKKMVNTTKFLALFVYERENQRYNQVIKVNELSKCEIESGKNFIKRTKA